MTMKETLILDMARTKRVGFQGLQIYGVAVVVAGWTYFVYVSDLHIRSIKTTNFCLCASYNTLPREKFIIGCGIMRTSVKQKDGQLVVSCDLLSKIFPGFCFSLIHFKWLDNSAHITNMMRSSNHLWRQFKTCWSTIYVCNPSFSPKA